MSTSGEIMVGGSVCTDVVSVCYWLVTAATESGLNDVSCGSLSESVWDNSVVTVWCVCEIGVVASTAGTETLLNPGVVPIDVPCVTHVEAVVE